VKYESVVLYRRVDGFSGNLCLFFNPLCTYYIAVFCMYVKLCSIFLYIDVGKVIVYVVLCPM
jgi:hypothetical protein